MIGSEKSLCQNPKISCLLSLLNMPKTGTEIYLNWNDHWLTLILSLTFSSMPRRGRRMVKSPDPLEEQRRKELTQTELGSGGLFGWSVAHLFKIAFGIQPWYSQLLWNYHILGEGYCLRGGWNICISEYHLCFLYSLWGSMVICEDDFPPFATENPCRFNVFTS